ncbi:MAG: FG-GAP-like repeat-containing protein [Verrucomicrobiota bacterium]|nr:FG-GAP-like repeat-containing protein [Verrucomicrobiota bacterium]
MKNAAAILLVLALLGCGGRRDAEEEVALEFRDAQGRRHDAYAPGRVAHELGQNQPFTGRVLYRYPNGRKETELTYRSGRPHGLGRAWHANGQLQAKGRWVEGRREGVWREWHSNGQLKQEMSYREGQRHGTAVSWWEDGTQEHSEVFDMGRRVWLIPGPGLEQRRETLERQREKLDATVWRREVAAQGREQVFVKLWDDIRAARDKWGPLETFSVGKLALGRAGEAMPHDWGITERRWEPPARELDAAAWQELVASLRANGWWLRETEWHQERYDETDEGARSEFAFVFHVEGNGQRHIARGRLRVDWREGRRMPVGLAVEELRVWTRLGAPPFRKWTVLDPRRDNPRALIPLAGGRSRTLAQPVLVHDLDEDGLPEILLAGSNLVYRNRGAGKFTPEPLNARFEGTIISAVLGDFDGDGRTDLLAAPSLAVPVLMRGGGDGRFTEAPKPLSLPGPRLREGYSFTAGDVDGDGDLDAWLTQYRGPYENGRFPTPYYDANDGLPSMLLVNDGRGRFTDGTAAAGLAAKRFRHTYSSSLVDLEGDGDLDLVVVSDFAGLDVYHNDGRGRFADVTAHLGAERFSFGMSHALADMDGDGRLDLYMTGMGSTTARRIEAMGLGRAELPTFQAHRMKMGYGNGLLLGAAGGALRQAAFNDELARTGWSWGCTAADFDNDGDVDLYIGNGHLSRKTAKDYCTTFWRHDIYTRGQQVDPAQQGVFDNRLKALEEESWNGFEHNVLFLNAGEGRFDSAGFLMGVGFEFDTRSVVGADLDADGRVDLVMVEDGWEPDVALPQLVHVVRNEWEGAGNWIGARLVGMPGRSPLGAVVTARADGRVWSRTVLAGDSFASQHPAMAHIGLGKTESVESLEVRWPDGTMTKRARPPLNQYHELKPR